MKLSVLLTLLPLLVSASPLLQSTDQTHSQLPLLSSQLTQYKPHPSILQALNEYPDDPIKALLQLKPELADHLAEPRLLDILPHAGDVERQPEPVWGTEGDKLLLRREGKGFVDVTENWELYQQVKKQGGLMAGKARK